MRHFVVISSFILFGTCFLWSSEYGTIKGSVIDSVTSKPVPDVGIYVEELHIYSVTDKRGNYTIDSIPAGLYTIRFPSHCGYDVIVMEQKIVEVDTAEILTLDFRCRDKREEVYRHMRLVGFLGTQSRYKPTSDLPATTTGELITLLPGITQSESGIHVRGGGADEIIYRIEGVETKIPYIAWQYDNLNLLSIEEIEIITGGFEAEYGNAQSGIVNITTKHGSSHHYGEFSYLGDDMFSGDKSNFGHNQSNFALGGPIINRVRYFLSGEIMLTDAFQEALYRIPSPKNDYDLFGKISYRLPSAKGELTISGLRSRDQYVAWNPSSEPGNAYKYFDQRPMTRTKNWLASASLEYMLTNRTRTTLRIGMTHVDQVFGNRDYEYEEENGGSWFNDFRLKAEHLIPYLTEDYLAANSLAVTDILLDSLPIYHQEYQRSSPEALHKSPYGVGGVFYTVGDFPAWSYWQDNGYQARFNLTQAVGRIHEFKTGIDYIRYDLRYYENSFPWVSNTFWQYVEREPYQWAGYLQDKIDWDLFCARLGVRFDCFDPNHEPIVYMFDPWIVDTVYFESSFKVSPRFGVALNISELTKIYFNYGHFYQPAIPTFVDSNALQKAVIYEAGFERQFLDDILIGINAYLKETDDGRNVKGLEFILNKRMSSMWAIIFSYNLQYAQGDNSWIGTWYHDHYDSEETLPSQNVWLDQDQRHVMKAILDFEFPGESFLPLEHLTSSTAISYLSGYPYTPENLAGYAVGEINSGRMPGYWNVDWKVSRRIELGPANLVFTCLINNLFNSKQIVDVYNTTGSPDDHGDLEPSVDMFSPITLTSAYYSPQGDYNHDGVMSSTESQADYLLARHDLYDDPTNYNNPFRMKLGIGIAF